MNDNKTNESNEGNEGEGLQVEPEGGEELQKYSILMSYLQYENSSFWNRNNFFILANTALLAFLYQKIQDISPTQSWEKIIIPLIYSVAGFFLSLLWRSGINISAFWIERWTYALKNIKEVKFNILFKPEKDPIKIKKPGAKYGAKYNALQVWRLFWVLWILSIGYFTRTICVKCEFCTLICILLAVGVVVLALVVTYRKELWILFHKFFQK